MFKPQLSESLEQLEEPLTFPKLVSHKIDGLRVLTKYNSALTRSMKPVPNQHIREMLSGWGDLDGEVVTANPTDKDVRRRTSSEVRSHSGTPNFTFYVFDDLTDISLPFEDRLTRLRAREFPEYIKVLAQQVVNSQEELEQVYERALADGHEGLIVRNPKSLYKSGRCTAKSQDSLKMKEFADSEAVVLNVYEALHNNNEAFTNELGRTARATNKENLTGSGMVGGFEVRDIKTGVEFRISAGVLTHKERQALWHKREEVKDLIVTYRHFEHGKKDKPQFGRFYSFRDTFDMDI